MTDARALDPRDLAHVAAEARLDVEAHAIENDALEDRVVRIEEIIAARWPRSWQLRRRLAKEIRASVDGFDEDFIPKANFRARRSEAVWQRIGEDPAWMSCFEALDRLPHLRR